MRTTLFGEQNKQNAEKEIRNQVDGDEGYGKEVNKFKYCHKAS